MTSDVGTAVLSAVPPTYLFIIPMYPAPELRARPHGIVIPAYEASGTLPRVLDALVPLVGAPRILVVDDGSTDGTSDAAAKRGVPVLRHPVNRGKGGALMTGLLHSRDHLGWEWAVTLDADGQHHPGDLEGFLAARPVRSTGMLAGARARRGTGMPWHRRFSNASTTWIVSRLAGRPVHDAQCGYRAYRLELAAILPREGRFDWESRALVLASRAGWDIERVPVRTVYTGEGSHMNLARDTLRFLCMAVELAWTR